MAEVTQYTHVSQEDQLNTFWKLLHLVLLHFRGKERIRNDLCPQDHREKSHQWQGMGLIWFLSSPARAFLNTAKKITKSIHASKSERFFFTFHKHFFWDRKKLDGPLDIHVLTALGPNTLFQVRSLVFKVLPSPDFNLECPVEKNELGRAGRAGWKTWLEGGTHPFLDFQCRISVSLWGPGHSQPCWRADPYEGHGNAAPQCGPQGMGEMREDRPGWQVL